MDYQKSIEILQSPDQQRFEYFLTLTAQQLQQLFEVVSSQHQNKIIAYFKTKNHTPLNPHPNAQLPFKNSIKSLYKKLFFSQTKSTQEKAQKQDDPESDNQNNEGKWFKHLFVVEETKQKIKQNQFNYPYYYVTKRLLTVHNASPNGDSVKTMHSLLEVLMKRIFSTKLMDGMKRLLGTNKESYNIPKQQAQKSINAVHLKNYLSKLFQKQYSNFMEFKQQYNQIKKDVAVQPSDNDDESEDQSQQQTKTLNQKQLHSIADTEEEINYYLMKTQTMNPEQLIEFYKFRQTNFIKEGYDKLISFTRIGGVLAQPKNRQLLELLSYILCMTVRRIIFTRIKELHDGKLLPTAESISSKDIQRIGNEYIEEVEKKAKSYCLKYQSYIKKAWDLFQQEFYCQGYDQIFLSETKIRLIKSEQSIIEGKDDQILEVWKKNKEYRKSWYERVIAEAQLKQFEEEDQQNKKQLKPINQYAQYLKDNKNIIRNVPSSKIFKSFLFKQPLQQKPSKPQKRLQSLFR